MKVTYKDFAHGAFSHTEEFQAEREELKHSIEKARKILDIRSRDAFVDFAQGPLMDSMRGELVKAFPVPDQMLDRFSSDVTSLLLDARDVAEETFHDASSRALKRPSKSLVARDWDVLKTDLRTMLREIAPHIAQLHIAAQDTPVQRPGLHHNV